jgi:protein gp37
MGELSKIAWTDHTFNPWWGCVRVSPGCTNCYAEAFDKRVHGIEEAHWGVEALRRMFGADHWREPLKWARKAKAAGVRHRVFCASMADVLEDRPDLVEPRERLWRLIDETGEWLTWLLLTKRPENALRMMPARWRHQPPPYVWWGTTVEDAKRARERHALLQAVPAAVRFWSYEPALEDLPWPELLGGPDAADDDLDVAERYCVRCGCPWDDDMLHRCPLGYGPPPDWVIFGGESGGGARPFAEEWALHGMAVCERMGVSRFMKQYGSRPTRAGRPLRLASYKGEDPAEFDPRLQVREFPAVGP